MHSRIKMQEWGTGMNVIIKLLKWNREPRSGYSIKDSPEIQRKRCMFWRLVYM